MGASQYVRRLPSINVLIQYSLTVWFDHTFFFQNIFGDHFLPFATIPKDAILGISFCLLHYPQDFHQLVKPPSLGASLGGEFLTNNGQTKLSWG